MKTVFQDWQVNAGCPLAQLLLIQFRLIRLMLSKSGFKILALLLCAFYKLYSQVLLNVELSPRTVIGPGLRLPHPYGIIINRASIIGSGCCIRHNVTLGNKGSSSIRDSSGCPLLGGDVVIGTGAVIIGEVNVGSNSVIGAGSIVVKDVPQGSIVVGNPARVLKK